jgi:hypothetical protein
MNNERYYYDFLEDIRWLEEKYPHIEKYYQPLLED